jgi:GAF domain-containing protein
MKPLIICHNDLDGLASGLGLASYLGEQHKEAEVSFVSYQELEDCLRKRLSERSSEEVYLADLSLGQGHPVFELIRGSLQRTTFFWFDHHGSSDKTQISLFRVAKVANGERCAWDLVREFTGPQNPLIEYIGRLAHNRDFWVTSDKEAFWVNDLVEEMGAEALFNKLIRGDQGHAGWIKTDPILRMAHARAQDRKQKSIHLAETTLTKIDNGWLWGVVFCRGYASDVAHEMMERHQLDAVALVDLTKFNNPLAISFRTRHPEIDVSKVAERLGGGGHRMAAGATVELKEINRMLLEHLLEQRSPESSWPGAKKGGGVPVLNGQERYIAALTAIRALANDSGKSWMEVLEQTVGILKKGLTKYTWVGIYLVDGEMLHLKAFLGKPSPHEHIPIGKGICGAAASTGKILNIPDVNADPRYLACSLETRSEIVVPILSGDRAIGEIDIDSDLPAAFGREDQQMLEEVAGILARRFERERG